MFITGTWYLQITFLLSYYKFMINNIQRMDFHQSVYVYWLHLFMACNKLTMPYYFTQTPVVFNCWISLKSFLQNLRLESSFLLAKSAIKQRSLIVLEWLYFCTMHRACTDLRLINMQQSIIQSTLFIQCQTIFVSSQSCVRRKLLVIDLNSCLEQESWHNSAYLWPAMSCYVK